MSSTRFHPPRLILYGLLLVAGFLAFARPDLLARLGGATEAPDPCTSPLAWHLRSVDPRFGFTTGEVQRAVEEAAGAWESVAGRRLFRRDSTGMAIDLVYDQRQEVSQELRDQRAGLAELEADLEALDSLLERLRARVDEARRRYERDGDPASLQAYHAAATRFNTTVGQYNEVIDRYHTALESARAAGGQEVRAGNLRSARRTLGGRVVRVDRELTIAVAGDYEELVVVLSHELGHALGIGHVSDPDALMAGRYQQRDVSLPVVLTPADRAALAEQCELDLLPADPANG